MKKTLFIMAAAASILALGACSSDAPQPSTTVDSVTGVEVINEPVEIRLGASSGVNLTRAALDDDAEVINLGIFCLAREPQNVNKTATAISWWDTSVDPLYSATFCLMDNVEYEKAGGEMTPTDGERRFYPFTQFYSYDFYAYYPYVATSSDASGRKLTESIGRVVVDYPAIDGQTDILWGRATSEKPYAYSAKYFRQPENQSETPTVQLDHMLTRLKFQVVPGESVVGNRNYSAAASMVVTGLKVKDVVKNVTLLVADFSRDSENEHGSDTKVGTDEPDRLTPTDGEVQTLSLCGADGEPFAPVNVSDDPNEPRQLGESLLLYPASKYVLEISLENTSGRTYQQDHPLELIHPTGQFEAGREYTITLEVHGPQEVTLQAHLTPWQESNLDGDGQQQIDQEL